MRPATVTTTIDAPRERVFEYLSDLANYSEFTDHFQKDYRLERVESRGRGAAARFRLESGLARLPLAAPLASMWVEVVMTVLEPPHRIVLEGATGRLGRVKTVTEFVLTRHDDNMTRLEATLWSDPPTRADRLRELLGARPWLIRQGRRSLRRLKSILEQGEPSARATRVAPG